MKRHPALIKLSKEHHDGLIIAQQMIKGAPRFKGFPSDLKGFISYSVTFYQKYLIPHFEDEEKILFPGVSGIDMEIDNIIDTLKDEHILLHNFFRCIQDSIDKENDLDKAGLLLENHIRKEERILFEKIQEKIPEELLASIGNKIR